MEQQVLLERILSLPAPLRKKAEDFIDSLLMEEYRVENKKPKRKAGSAKGEIVMLPGFDDPLEEFEEYS